MACTIGMRSLEAYHDRELDASASAAFEAHLAGCSECRRDLAALVRELRLYHDYVAGASREPPPRIWNEIRMRLDERHGSARWLGWRGAAVAACAAMAVGSLVLIQHARLSEERSVRAIPRAPESRVEQPVPPSAAIQRAERDYVEAIRLVSAGAEARKAALDPATRRVVERNLEIVDRTIDASRRAYRENPNDLDLAEYLLSAYSRKLEVLRDLAS
jgi:hypothetical protein